MKDGTLGELKEWWWAPWRERSPYPRRNAVSRHADDALVDLPDLRSTR